MDDEFWELTPVDLDLLVEKWNDKEYRSFLKSGVVAATIANVHRDPDKQPTPFTAEDFAPQKKRFLTVEECERLSARFPMAQASEVQGFANGSE